MQRGKIQHRLERLEKDTVGERQYHVICLQKGKTTGEVISEYCKDKGIEIGPNDMIINIAI